MMFSNFFGNQLRVSQSTRRMVFTFALIVTASVFETGFGQEKSDSKDKAIRELRQISNLMNLAASDMNAGNVGSEARMRQQEVIRRLKRLLPVESNNSSDSKKSSGQDSQADSQTGSSTNTDQADRNQSENSDNKTRIKLDQPEMARVIENEWGQLPEKLRQQIMNAFQPKFLRGYERQIEQYYKKLDELDKKKKQL